MKFKQIFILLAIIGISSCAQKSNNKEKYEDEKVDKLIQEDQKKIDSMRKVLLKED